MPCVRRYERVAAELVHADLEGHARARRRLLEHQRDASCPRACVVRARSRLSSRGAVEQRRATLGAAMSASVRKPRGTVTPCRCRRASTPRRIATASSSCVALDDERRREPHDLAAGDRQQQALLAARATTVRRRRRRPRARAAGRGRAPRRVARELRDELGEPLAEVLRRPAATRSSRPSVSMMSNTASAAAHASGLPPNVDACGTAPPAAPRARPRPSRCTRSRRSARRRRAPWRASSRRARRRRARTRTTCRCGRCRSAPRRRSAPCRCRRTAGAAPAR